MIVLDTDVLSALAKENAERVVREWLDTQPRSSVWTTSVTVFEVRFGLALMPTGQRRSRLQAAFRSLGRGEFGRTRPVVRREGR